MVPPPDGKRIHRFASKKKRSPLKKGKKKYKVRSEDICFSSLKVGKRMLER